MRHIPAQKVLAPILLVLLSLAGCSESLDARSLAEALSEEMTDLIHFEDGEIVDEPAPESGGTQIRLETITAPVAVAAAEYGLDGSIAFDEPFSVILEADQDLPLDMLGAVAYVVQANKDDESLRHMRIRPADMSVVVEGSRLTLTAVIGSASGIPGNAFRIKMALVIAEQQVSNYAEWNLVAYPAPGASTRIPMCNCLAGASPGGSNVRLVKPSACTSPQFTDSLRSSPESVWANLYGEIDRRHLFPSGMQLVPPDDGCTVQLDCKNSCIGRCELDCETTGLQCDQSASCDDSGVMPVCNCPPGYVDQGGECVPDSGCQPGYHLEGQECLLNVVQVAVGYQHGCALLYDNTMMCWGYNLHGELGDGTTQLHAEPVKVPNLTDLISIAVGQHQTCAIRVDGNLWCWGWNAHGQLGIGTIDDQHTPVQVPGIGNVTAVSIGYGHTCALLDDATVMCWGWNIRGEVGDGTTTDRSTPMPVTGLANVTSLAAGATHNCALHQDGSASCWGLADDGRLGDGAPSHQVCSTYDCSPVPVSVAGFTNNITSISAGGHTCVQTSGMTPFCWAQNEYGQLGDGSMTGQPLAVEVQGVANVERIQAGDFNSCAVTTNGSVFCWGRNDFGQLGDGPLTHQDCAGVDCSPVPVAVVRLQHPAWEVSIGIQSACALLEGGSVMCWGRNDYGQLGDGSSQHRNEPVLLVHPSAGDTDSL